MINQEKGEFFTYEEFTKRTKKLNKKIKKNEKKILKLKYKIKDYIVDKCNLEILYNKNEE